MQRSRRRSGWRIFKACEEHGSPAAEILDPPTSSPRVSPGHRRAGRRGDSARRRRSRRTRGRSAMALLCTLRLKGAPFARFGAHRRPIGRGATIPLRPNDMLHCGIEGPWLRAPRERVREFAVYTVPRRAVLWRLRRTVSWEVGSRMNTFGSVKSHVPTARAGRAPTTSRRAKHYFGAISAKWYWLGRGPAELWTNH
jgi:hypothetical protein